MHTLLFLPSQKKAMTETHSLLFMTVTVASKICSWVPTCIITSHITGSTVASYAGNHVHKRLVREDAYKEQDWKLALKRAFLDTDEDIRQGTTPCTSAPMSLINILPTLDPDFVYDSSGCTAVAALLTRDRRIFVVRRNLLLKFLSLSNSL